MSIYIEQICAELKAQRDVITKMQKAIAQMDFSLIAELKATVESLDIAICKLLQATKANQFSLAHLEQRERNGQKHT